MEALKNVHAYMRNFFKSGLEMSLYAFDFLLSEKKYSYPFPHIAEFMTRFLESDAFFTQDGGRIKINGLCDMVELAASHQNNAAYCRQAADYGLFVSGMFPEFLEKRNMLQYYEDVGAAYYRRQLVVPQPHFEMLADNFPVYRILITHMRDTHMHFEETSGKIRISPNYEKLRAKAVQHEDGKVEWIM